jgi:hypothetical protein
LRAQVEYGNGTNGGIHLSSNAYLTFGGSGSAFSNLGPSSPPFPTLFLGAGDNSYQRVYAGMEASGSGRVRYEGTAATTGNAGAPDIVFEIVFEPSGALQVAIGAHARCPGAACLSGLSDGAGGWYLYNPNTSVQPDTRYRFGGLASATPIGPSSPSLPVGPTGFKNWACISASALPVSLGVVGANSTAPAYDVIVGCGMLANATGYAVFGMVPADGGGFNCLAASSPNVTAADLMAGGAFPEEQCGTPCFPNSVYPVCGFGDKAFIFEAFYGDTSGSGGGKSYSFDDLACIPGALMPVPLGAPVPAADGATVACADQAAAEGRTLFAMKPTATAVGSFDCLGAASASATSADILAAAAAMNATLGNGNCDTPCFGAGNMWPICGKGDNAFLFDVRITGAPTPSSPTPGDPSLSPMRVAVTSPASLVGLEGLDLVFEGSLDDASTRITVPFSFFLGNVRWVAQFCNRRSNTRQLRLCGRATAATEPGKRCTQSDLLLSKSIRSTKQP